MESDAERVIFGDHLSKVMKDMTKHETDQLKFLCLEYIPASTMDQMNITGLLQFLKKKSIISADKYNFLTECLILIGRNDIAHQLGCDKFNMSMLASYLHEYKSFAGLNSFIILLHTLANGMDEKEVEKLVAYILRTAYVTRGKIKTCHNGFQLMSALLKIRHIHANNLKNLFDLVRVLERKDLEVKIKLYQDTHRSSDGSYRPTSYTHRSSDGSYRPTSYTHRSSDGSYRPTSYTHRSSDGSYRPTSFIHSSSEESYKPTSYTHSSSDESHKPTSYAHSSSDESYKPTSYTHRSSDGSYRPTSYMPGVNKNKSNEDDDNEERSLQHYKMTAKPRGICLIFNNVHFMVERLEDRTGSDVDKDALVEVFTNFHFEITVYSDLTKTEMREKLDEAGSMDHGKYDCFVCCILSHGIKETVYGVDGEPLPYKDIKLPFQPSKCRSLTGKPKLFFIQACQGLAYQWGEDDIEFDCIPRSVPTSIPNEADFLMSYATVEGYVSFRSKKNGSWFIQNLCKVFRDYSKKYDLSDMLLMVNNSVSKKDGPIGDQIYKQVPAPLSTLRKKVFF